MTIKHLVLDDADADADNYDDYDGDDDEVDILNQGLTVFPLY